MQRLFFLVLLLRVTIWGDWGNFFPSNEDSIINNHVNVITGRLQLSFQDHVIPGAVLMPLQRTYTNYEEIKPSHSKWNFSQGWSFFSHILLYYHEENGYHTAEIVEMNGGKVVYLRSKRGEGEDTYEPHAKKDQNSEAMNYRDDPRNNKMTYYKKDDMFFLTLADGSFREYRRKKLNISLFSKIKRYLKGDEVEYILHAERSASGVLTTYIHEDDGSRLTVVLSSANQKKFYASIRLDLRNKDSNFLIHLNTSDKKQFNYHGTAIDGRNHLSNVSCSFKPLQSNRYNEFNSQKGGWLDQINCLDKTGLKILYHFPKDYKNPNKDKVDSIFQNGILLASFNYTDEYTDVRNEENILTRYHHKDRTLTKIEYFDKNDRLYRKECFHFENGSLVLKENFDGLDHLFCYKRYSYDQFKNLSLETIFKDEESYSKWYFYNEKHLLIKEQEESGLTTTYEYVRKTDLISSKKTIKEDVIYFEERFIYDKEALLIEKISYDGFIKSYERYRRNEHNGMIEEMENGLSNICYTYNEAKLIVEEKSPFSLVTTDYDAAGREIKKRFANNGVNEYVYDQWANAIEIKEVGSDRKYIEYDDYNRPIVCTMNGKVSRNTYNIKGLILTQTDHNNSVTTFTYDCFDRCIKKKNPVGGEEFFEYDIVGNVIMHTALNGAVTKTSYNLFNQPKAIIYPNGSKVRNVYNKDGTLKEIYENDLLKTSFEYDPLKRIIRKVTASLEENWLYEGALVKKYKDIRGLITTYNYDEHGRKIKESSLDREKEFFYDEMGFVKEIKTGDHSITFSFDPDGRVLQSSENGFTQVINEFDREGRKTSARKMTSEGEALDQFFYDEEGSLICHIDPLEQKTLFIYDHLEKVEIDPLGNKTVTKFNPVYKEIEKQKLSFNDELLFTERFFYDISGNLIKRLTDGFNLTVEYKYDIMGKLLEEVESGIKKTSYVYDIKGLMIKKIFPSGVFFEYEYDDLDRKIVEKSSDKNIFHEYHYLGADLVEIKDQVLKKSIKRGYNIFGELTDEINFSGFKTAWYYNTFGKVEKMVLPDDSFICYSYQNGHLSKIERFDKKGVFCYSHHYSAFDPNYHVKEEELPFNLGKVYSKRDLLERSTKMQSPYHTIEHSYNPTSLVTKKTNSLTGNKDYNYDDLSQITKEGDIVYDFDPLGNPKDAKVNKLNQLIKTPKEELSYDKNGNLIQQGDIKYSYDSLNRLRVIKYKNGKLALYSYDPLSRLVDKRIWSENKITSAKSFLYDKEYEIGSRNDKGHIDELKILGLGIKGDIGAAVAIELKEKVYIPLHDLQGNIIALVDQKGKLEESYNFSAFGEEKKTSYINPWRFGSKRFDEDLIFFGLRFYKPSIKRWITPDPLGFIDSRNPYLFVLNNPLNRLDEFGLSVEGMLSMPPSFVKFPYEKTIEPVDYTSSWIMNDNSFFYGPAKIDGVRTYVSISAPKFFNLNITLQEKEQKSFNLMSRLPELLKGAENQISVVIFQNGINNSVENWLEMGKTLQKECPLGTIIIGLYNSTQGIGVDLGRTALEKVKWSTKSTSCLEGLFKDLFQVFHESAPSAKMLHICHSEGGAVYSSMCYNTTDEQKRNIQNTIYCLSVGSAECLGKKLGFKVLNLYSDKDCVTGGFAKLNDPAYDVKILKCITPWQERMGGFADHGFIKQTYSAGRKSYIQDVIDNKGGFYVPSCR